MKNGVVLLSCCIVTKLLAYPLELRTFLKAIMSYTAEQQFAIFQIFSPFC